MRAVFVVPLAVLLCASRVFAATSADIRAGQASLRVVQHGPFRITSAYFAESLPWTTPAPSGPISDNSRFCGDSQIMPNTTAAPGVLSFCTTSSFASCPPGYGQLKIQSMRLTKEEGACPSFSHLNEPAVYHQFGSFGIRTWWALIFTPPGTRFTLDLTVRCVRNVGGRGLTVVDLHIDRWVWEVVVTFDSLRAVIDVLHSSAIGMTEIPCIASEYLYDGLQADIDDIQRWLPNRTQAQEAVMDMEGEVVLACAAEEFFVQSDFFTSFPPSDLGGFSIFGITELIDTTENPCCCKILADVEALATAYHIWTPDQGD